MQEATRNEFSGEADNVVQAGKIGEFRIGATRRPLPIPRQLPRDVWGFTDRTAHIDRLDSLIHSPESGSTATITVITGTAGIGKTSLAVHWAHRVRERFPDGQLYVNLHGYSPGRPVTTEQVLDGFLRAFDVPPSQIPRDLESLASLYRSLLHDRSLLVLLDNALTPEQVRPLLPAAPRCVTIITTRSPLSGLVIHEGAVRVTVEPLLPENAVALLRTVVGEHQVDAEPDAVATVARQSGYLPLALRIIAEQASLPGTTFTELARDLAVERERLDAFTTVEDSEVSEVRSVFSWSYHNLSPRLARLFRLLALHAGPEISTGAAGALAAIGTGEARRSLDSLVGFNMLERIGRDRYRFHDLLRAYALERLEADESSEERTAAFDRELGWYVHTADASDRVFAPMRRHVPLEPPDDHTAPVHFADHQEALDWCDAERLNLLATIRQAAEKGRHTFAWKLAIALVTYYKIRKHRQDWLISSEIALGSARALGDLFAEGWCLTSFGGALHAVGRFEAVMEQYQRSLTVCRTLGDRTGEGMALSNLGEALRDLGRLDEAVAHGEQAIVIWQELGDRRMEAITLIDCVAGVRLKQERYEEGLEVYKQALRASTGIDVHSEGHALQGLGHASRGLDRPAEAVERFNEALRVQRRSGDRYGAAETLRGLAAVWRDQGDTAAATEALLDALRAFTALEDPQAEEVRAELRGLGVDVDDSET